MSDLTQPAMLVFRDAVIRELKERFGVRAIVQAPPKYNSASAGMMESHQIGQGDSSDPGDCDS